MSRRLVASLAGQEIDSDIFPLVKAIRSNPLFVTVGSCSGHGREPAYVDLGVEGIVGLRTFLAALNRVEPLFKEEAFIDVALNWCDGVATSSDFDEYPDWIMISLVIASDEGGPAPGLLKRLARAFEKEARRECLLMTS